MNYDVKREGSQFHRCVRKGPVKERESKIQDSDRLLICRDHRKAWAIFFSKMNKDKQ